jgi:hypothetical protein
MDLMESGQQDLPSPIHESIYQLLKVEQSN